MSPSTLLNQAPTTELLGKPFKLYRDLIAVEIVKDSRKSEGGVDLPDTVENRHHEGNVVAYGPQTSVHLGQTVIFSGYAGVDYEFERTKLVLVREGDILAVRG